MILHGSYKQYNLDAESRESVYLTSGQKAVAPAAPQQQTQQAKNTPIMVTPYRHNWLISGSHRGNQEAGGP